MALDIQAGWLKFIKANIKDLTFISPIQEHGQTHFMVHIRNDQGGRDKIKYVLSTPVKFLRSSDYEWLYEQLKNKSYVQEAV